MSPGTIRISLYGNAILGFFAGFSCSEILKGNHWLMVSLLWCGSFICWNCVLAERELS